MMVKTAKSYQIIRWSSFEAKAAIINNSNISWLVERSTTDQKIVGSLPDRGSLSNFNTSIFVEDNKTLISKVLYLKAFKELKTILEKNCSATLTGKIIFPTAISVGQ